MASHWWQRHQCGPWTLRSPPYLALPPRCFGNQPCWILFSFGQITTESAKTGVDEKETEARPVLPGVIGGDSTARSVTSRVARGTTCLDRDRPPVLPVCVCLVREISRSLPALFWAGLG